MPTDRASLAQSEFGAYLSLIIHFSINTPGVRGQRPRFGRIAKRFEIKGRASQYRGGKTHRAS